MREKRVLLICGASHTVITFRDGLIRALRAADYSVYVVGFGEEYAEEIVALGVQYYPISDSNRSLNPIRAMALTEEYFQVIKRVNADMVCTFQLKPNIFGALAARRAGVKNVYAMVEGVGDVFIRDTPKWLALRRVVCSLYKRSFRMVKKVVFLNEEDRAEFLRRGLVKGAQCETIRGIGVDLDKFSFSPVRSPDTFLMVARMYKTKGVLEYCEAARAVKRKYPTARFCYIGSEGELKSSDLTEYVEEGSVEYLGAVKDVRPYLADCGVFVLPSYREGLPVSVLEAESTGRAILASDVVGCKDTVFSGKNGFLTAAGDSASLAERMIWFLEHAEEVRRMGRQSRRLAEERFDCRPINKRLLSIWEESWQENA